MDVRQWIDRRRHDIKCLRERYRARRAGNRSACVTVDMTKIFTRWGWIVPLSDCRPPWEAVNSTRPFVKIKWKRS
jgi:hypothetical protein